jgi:hypothetical protein
MNVALPADVEADLRTVLREAPTDAGNHTATTDVDVRVVATADRLTAEVTEYGTGTISRLADDGSTSVQRWQPGTRMTWSVTVQVLACVS